MSKKFIFTAMLALVTMTMQAQKLPVGEQSSGMTKVWNDIVTGYVNVPIIEVTKVAIYEDRTEVFFHLEAPKQAIGQSGPIATKPSLHADGKTYAVKGATVISLTEPYTIPANGQVDFSLIFEPIPANTWMIDVAEPNRWSIANIRDAKNTPSGINDTYWRDETTGDWLIGFTPTHVIYNNKVYDIATRTEKKDNYTLTLDDGTTVKVGKMKKGQRPIAIGNAKPMTCSPITGIALPDYPSKDQRTGFVDNGYKQTDSVTIIGWLKDMPEEAWKRKGREFGVEYVNILKAEQESSYALMDSLGRFTLTMPLLNTTQVFLDWGRTTHSTVLEPGKTYFFLSDFKTGQKLWMGDDVRVQNEMLCHPHEWPIVRPDFEHQGTLNAMEFKGKTDSARNASMAKLEEVMQQHPNLSQRYIDYVKGFYQTSQAESMMQARFQAKNFELPQEYMDYVGKELWQKAIKPYTLYRDFSTFMRDYLDQIISKRVRNSADETVKVIKRLEQQGVVALTDKENEAFKLYIPMIKELEAKLQTSHNGDTIQALIDAFNGNENVKKVYALFERIGEPFQKEMGTFSLRDDLAVLDSLGSDNQLRDIYIARYLYRFLDSSRQPLSPALMEYAEQQIKIPAALDIIKTLNDKYLAIQNMDMSKLTILKSNDDVANMTDGEKILRKILEPYKGKIILLDIWGTWCGPCKEALSHSQEEYKRLKDFDVVYLYLANRSDDESWKNVIKEYNVIGDNVVHYNLPTDQQAAVEHFLNVHGWPTYKLFDRNGNLLDLNVDARHLEDLARLMEKL